MSVDSLTSVTTVADAPPTDAGARAPSVDRTNTTLGRFALKDKLGEGGMGEVYAAHDPKLDRKVALKVLPARLGLGRNAKARLIREAKALARLSHPNVVAVFDAGTHEDEVYIAMELVEGQTIRQWLQAQPRSWVEVLEIFVAAGQGLAAIHEHGLVHRDFKPDNVLVDDRGRVRLIDFGLVRRLEPDEEPADEGAAAVVPPDGAAGAASLEPAATADLDASPMSQGPPTAEDGADEPAEPEDHAPPSSPTFPGADSLTLPEALTKTGALVGTVRYMAPEQFCNQAVTDRSDQFSFCVALYESLFGYSPFTGKTPKARAYEVMFGKVGPVPRDSDVPPELTAVLTRGLRRPADERWPSMAELLETLESLLLGHDPELRDPQVHRVRTLMLIASLGMLLGTLGVFGLLVATDVIAYSARTQIAMDATLVLLFGSTAWWARPHWTRHRRPRHLVGLLMFVLSMYLAQDLMGWLAGRSLYDSALASLVSVTLVLLFGAPLLVSTLRWCGLWTGACAAALLLDPSRFPLYFALANVGAGVVGVLVLPRRAQLRWISAAATEGSTSRGPP